MTAVAQRGTVAVRLVAEATTDMTSLGQRLAQLLRAGDLVLLHGPLGAGKTTLTRGIGAGLAVRGDVSSPTFVIARRHRPADQGPPLLHIDAYRLSADELADLELDVEAGECVAVVEWGRDKVESWSRERLEVEIALTGDDPDAPRTLTITGYGQRWSAAGLADLEGSR